MAKRAETLRKPQCGWGRASRVAHGSILAMSLLVGVSALSAEPLEADATRTSPSTSVERTAPIGTPSQALSTPQMSVSAFSAAQSDAARVLLAQEVSGESNRAVGTTFPGTVQSGAAPRQGEAQVRLEQAAEEQQTEESAIVGRSLRAYTRAEEESEVSGPRRRASFSSAISRAAAAGALTSTNPNASISNALSASRFTPATNSGQFDPGFSQAAEVLSAVPGLRLESATLFGGYSSNALPQGLVSGSQRLGNVQLGADYDIGASALLSYTRNGRRSSTSLSYAPSHVQRSRIPEWSTTDHRFSFRTSRDLTPRLSWQSNANAGNTGLEQFWRRPAITRQVEMPSSFQELMRQVQAGEISDDEFAALLTGSPVVDDPGGSVQELNRIFSMSVGTSASYRYSRRLTFRFGGDASTRRLFLDSLEEQGRNARYLNAASTTNGNISADYRLSSRTSISLSHVTTFADSTLVRSTAQSPTISVNQVLSRHWTYQVGAGVGKIEFHEGSRAQSALSGTTTWTAHGLLGYTTGAHNVSLSGSKRVGDPMGFGSRETVQAGLNWAWQPRFSPWGANAGIAFSRSDFSGGQLLNRDFASDLYSAGLSRRLTPSTTFRSDYYFGEYITPFSGVASNMAVHRMQLSLEWRPAEPRR